MLKLFVRDYKFGYQSKRIISKSVFCLLTSVFCLLPSVYAQPVSMKPPVLQDVGIDQLLNNQIPLDLEFKDETGRTVKLSEYFKDKPVVLSLVYYDCPRLCTQVLSGCSGL